MIKALYLDDSHLLEFSTSVQSIKDEKFVVLEKTAFYPESGGQPHDTGSIIRKEDGKVFRVVHVGKFSGEISHEVDAPGLKEGDLVQGSVDKDRRNMFRRMHTAAHILSAIFHKEAGALITGNQLGTDKSRLDFSTDSFDREKIDGYFALANKIVDDNHPIKVTYLPKQEAEKDSMLFKLAKGLPPGIDIIRIVSIGEIDSQADGGTHVDSTSEIGKIVFLKAENKGKTNRRVYFTLG